MSSRRILEAGSPLVQFEICICAAVKSTDGEIIRCHRHAYGLHVIIADHMKLPARGRDAQGFITSRNRFVDRVEGRALQIAAGVESAYPGGWVSSTELFSEDLY